MKNTDPIWPRWLWLLLALGLFTAPAQAQYDLFLRFAGTNGTFIPGTSQDTRLQGRDGWSPIQGFSLGAINDASTGQRTSFVDFTIDGPVSSTSPVTFEALASGRNLPLAELAVRRTTETGVFLTYEFKPVRFTGQTWAGGTAAVPHENLRMSYTALRMTFRPQNPNGSLGSPVVGQWNLATGTPTF